MKTLILFSGIVAGLALGMFPKLEKPRPLWWQGITIVIIFLTLFLGILPPIAGSLRDAVLVGRATPEAHVPVIGNLQQSAEGWTFTDSFGKTVQLRSASPNIELPQQANNIIIRIQRGNNDTDFIVHSVGATNPMITYPYIPALEERARNIFYHVPMAWVGMLAYFISMWYGFRFLRTNDLRYDAFSAEAAALGTVFTILATTTGMVWAKFNWGAFWNWDPRQTSIFVLLLIYGAYFSLRSAIADPRKRARLASVYAMLSAIAAVFLIYIMPRLVDGLHPGSADSGNAGPVLSSQDDTLNPVKQAVFALAFTGFSAVFYWLLSIRMRVAVLRQQEL